MRPLARDALKFFAIQVGFSNEVSAHGGPQAHGGALKANWGALSSDANYALSKSTPESVRLEVFERMQNAA